MKTRLIALLLLLGIAMAHSASTPPSTDELLAEAGKQAAADKKAIYVHFSASWCGWCKRHEAFLELPAVKPVFEKYFVPVEVVVQETEENKALENPGSTAFLQKMGGPAGLPFSAFLDVNGKLIVNSKTDSDKGAGGGNIGHPVAPEEIAWFVVMMKKAAPDMMPDDLAVIESALKNQKR